LLIRNDPPGPIDVSLLPPFLQRELRATLCTTVEHVSTLPLLQ
jgi:hypothetical protein